MAPMGTSTGDWSVCVQLLHSLWPNTAYKGTITLVFDEIDVNDVIAPVLKFNASYHFVIKKSDNSFKYA